MTYRGIITGTAMTKNTPIEAISLNAADSNEDNEQKNKN